MVDSGEDNGRGLGRREIVEPAELVGDDRASGCPIERDAPRNSADAECTRNLSAEAIDDENTQKRLLTLGGEIPDKARRGQQPLAGLVKDEIARWTPIIKAASIKAE